MENEQVLIEGMIYKPGDTDATKARAFEVFACEQALKGRGLSIGQVEEGVVGSGDDGGIDGVYLFVNHLLVREDDTLFDPVTEASSYPKQVPIELWIVQAKRTASFSETTFDLLSSSLGRLLNFNESEANLSVLYNEDVVQAFMRFRQAVTKLGERHPKLMFKIAYAAMGSTTGIHQKVMTKASDLEGMVANAVAGAEADSIFLGAVELWKLHMKTPTYTLGLTFKNLLNADDGHVALVRIGDYLKMITNDEDKIRSNIFEDNVRDFAGDVAVNREIVATLKDGDSYPFWWLNNGITILSSEVTSKNMVLYMDGVQIVNGLQTSHAMFETKRDGTMAPEVENRELLIKVIETDDMTARDRVTRATNRQTSVTDASLRASDDIQRMIEQHLGKHGLSYERRKNFYRNRGVQRNALVSITGLAQAVMAVGLALPDEARARPSSLLNDDQRYAQIFQGDVPLDIYRWSAEALRDVDAALIADSGVSGVFRSNFRFHVLAVAAWLHFGEVVNSLSAVAKLPVETLDSPLSQESISGAVDLVMSTLEDKSFAPPYEKVAKGKALVVDLIEATTTALQASQDATPGSDE